MRNSDLVIIGTGGMGRELLSQLLNMDRKSNCYNILGFIDKDANLQGKMVNNYPILGDDIWLLNYPDDINAVIGVGNSQIRKQTFDKFSKMKNIIFPNIIASDVKRSNDIVMGMGNIICSSSVLTVNISIGDCVIINLACTISHDVTIGNFVTINPGTNIAGNVFIGECSEIGIGAKIIQGKTIGDNVIIGAGAVVVKDIPSNCTAVGVPAKPNTPPPDNLELFIFVPLVLFFLSTRQ
jgi:sugar O-acyltransferase (sialic acid O-acetyltransferase NeuD family)